MIPDPNNDCKQLYDSEHFLGRAHYDPMEAHQRYLDGTNAWAKERQRIFDFSRGGIAKNNSKKSGFSWRRTLLFTSIYFGYCILGWAISKYFPSWYMFMFSWGAYAGTNWIMGVKFGDYFWDDKTED